MKSYDHLEFQAHFQISSRMIFMTSKWRAKSTYISNIPKIGLTPDYDKKEPIRLAILLHINREPQQQN